MSAGQGAPGEEEARSVLPYRLQRERGPADTLHLDSSFQSRACRACICEPPGAAALPALGS